MALAVVLGVFTAGYSKEQDSKSGKTKLAFITNNTANFWVFAKRGCEKAASESPEYGRCFQDYIGRNACGTAKDYR